MNNNLELTGFASEGLNRLDLWRNQGIDTPINDLGKTVVAAVGLSLLMSVAVVETVVYSVFTALATLVYFISSRPFNYLSQLTKNSCLTIALCFVNIFSTAQKKEPFSVNKANLRLAPKPIDYGKLRNNTSNVNTQELLTQFDKIFEAMSSDDDFCDDDFCKLSKREARYAIHDSYVNLHSYWYSTPYEEGVTEEIGVFLKNIILELRKEETPLEKKKEALQRLAGAAKHCKPRRHAEALKVWRILSNQTETVNDAFLEYLQMVKEDLFQNYYSLSREPVQTLNYIRSQVGTVLGLDTNPINLQDQYIHLNDARSPENPHVKHKTAKEFLSVFNRIYKPDTIIPLMKDYLNERMSRDNEFCNQISQYIDSDISNLVKSGKISELYAENLPAPYQDESTFLLTDVGVKYLLVYFGILNGAESLCHVIPVGGTQEV